MTIIIIIVAVIIIGIIAYSLLRSKRSNKIQEDLLDEELMTEEELKEIAQELNEECPKKIEDNVHLVRVTSGPGMCLSYFYTISHVADNALTKENLQNMRENITAHCRNNEDLKIYRDSGVTLRFVYFDKNGNKLLKVECK